MLCGWQSGDDLAAFLESLVSEGALCRAAAIAVFSLRLRHAIELLTRGVSAGDTGDNLGVVAMALSGQSIQHSRLLRFHLK